MSIPMGEETSWSTRHGGRVRWRTVERWVVEEKRWSVNPSVTGDVRCERCRRLTTAKLLFLLSRLEDLE